MSMDEEVKNYLKNITNWSAEIGKLRQIALECQLDEVIKWGQLCYTFQGDNIVLIQGFKDYCAYLFFEGEQLRDSGGILIKTGPNTNAARQVRFVNLRRITELEATLKEYISQAVELVRKELVEQV